MIKEFKSGKWYRWIGPKDWKLNKEMEFILDGNPHISKGRYASFYDSPDPGYTWFWGDELQYFEEVPAPNKHPEPFNDGEYLHYTRFHPQLRDMIGTEGYFYDGTWSDRVYRCMMRPLTAISPDGFPIDEYGSWAYFAVPIKKITPQIPENVKHIAEKVGVSDDELGVLVNYIKKIQEDG